MACECVDAKGRCSHTMTEETVELHDHYLPCDWEHICLPASGKIELKLFWMLVTLADNTSTVYNLL